MANITAFAPRRRAKDYRELAQEARALAAKAPRTAQASFLQLAAKWDRLANNAEDLSEEG